MESASPVPKADCIRCGASFDCGAGSGNCWCMELPALPMPPDATGCFCRACLEVEIAQVVKASLAGG
jgi:hypothetical protein